MADATAPAFRIGYVLSQAFSILFRNFISFWLLTLLITSPDLILNLMVSGPNPSTEPPSFLSFGFLTLIDSIIPLVLTQLAVAALVYGTIQELRGRRVTFGDCLKRALAILLPILGVVLLMTMAIFIGVLLLVIPGLIVMTVLWVAIPVAVIERPGVLASLRRSRELTSGHRWKVFATSLIVMILGFFIATGVSLLLGYNYFLSDVDPYDLTTTAQVSLYFVQAFNTAVYAVAIGVGYYTLRAEKDGVDIEQIAAVFD